MDNTKVNQILDALYEIFVNDNPEGDPTEMVDTIVQVAAYLTVAAEIPSENAVAAFRTYILLGQIADTLGEII